MKVFFQLWRVTKDSQGSNHTPTSRGYGWETTTYGG